VRLLGGDDLQSLEKKTFLLPQDYYAMRDRIFVQFNLSVIPRDMTIKTVTLHLPLPKISKPTRVYVKEILGHWDGARPKVGRPTGSRILQKVNCIPGQDELTLSIARLVKKGKRGANTGIYVRVKNVRLCQTNPPYLVLETI
jgi:hypothetical protein